MRQERNKAVRSELKTRTRSAVTAAEAGADDADAKLRAAIKRIDTAVAKGVIHRNAAARRKADGEGGAVLLRGLSLRYLASRARRATSTSRTSVRPRLAAAQVEIGAGQQLDRLDHPLVAQPAPG